MRDIVILGGPNGAGKTTVARTLIPEKLNIEAFLNADEIARGLSPFDVDRAAITAGRIMLQRMRELIERNRNFAFETTCSGRSYFPMLRACRAAGWRINLLYLWLPSPEAAIERVVRRVDQGGHAIPTDVIVRRYWAGLKNMRELYLPAADIAGIFDNSDQHTVAVAELSPEGGLVIHDHSRWNRIMSMSP